MQHTVITGNESEIFDRLAKICSLPGFAHVVACFCLRDNFIRYSKEMQPSDLEPFYKPERLIRTEISTLIGLVYRSGIDLTDIGTGKVRDLFSLTENCLKELHDAIYEPVKITFNKSNNVLEYTDVQKTAIMREAIFYAGESGYHFQYTVLAIKKYKNDNEWLLKNKGYRIEDAVKVIKVIESFLHNKLEKLYKSELNEITVIEGFTFSIENISNYGAVSPEIVTSVVQSFVSPIENKNEMFNSISAFNITNAFPIIKISATEYLLFQKMSLYEALYETPFFWLNADNEYKNIAAKNRGRFTEEFSAERLKLVFGEQNVYQNVLLTDSKKQQIGEIDVLVIYANRFIIIQAKSKKLTIEARKGNDKCVQSDFKKAIQDAYDQGLSCAKEILNCDNCTTSVNGKELKIKTYPKEIYLFCVVSEHYPALNYQVQHYLKTECNNKIMPPFIMDVFLLDVMTEMLQSPLHFVSYINRRALYSNRILANNELTTLAFHLGYNLWVEEKYNHMYLEDSLCTDLDLAMIVRREGIKGASIPKGILTFLKGLSMSTIVNQLTTMNDVNAIDVGLYLLKYGGEALKELSEKIIDLSTKAQSDFLHHDLIIGNGMGKGGIIVHCNYEPYLSAREKLHFHCKLKKYSEKSSQWFGISIEPATLLIKDVVALDYKWEYSNEMESLVATIPAGARYYKGYKNIGRNDNCFCGSGKKYKKCCLKENQ